MAKRSIEYISRTPSSSPIQIHNKGCNCHHGVYSGDHSGEYDNSYINVSDRTKQLLLRNQPLRTINNEKINTDGITQNGIVNINCAFNYNMHVNNSVKGGSPIPSPTVNMLYDIANVMKYPIPVDNLDIKVNLDCYMDIIYVCEIYTVNENNVREGLTVYYHPGGNKFCECNYINGVIHGQFKHYENGKLRAVCDYTNGIKNGVHTLYDNNMNMVSFTSYKHNMKNGLYQKSYANGIIEYVGEYKNNLRHSQWIRFYENGTICGEIMYSFGKIVGQYKLWDKNGKIVLHEIYDNTGILQKKIV
jgi:antitoxin component YwqK of YwqJK toxin-antitoxin module